MNYDKTPLIARVAIGLQFRNKTRGKRLALWAIRQATDRANTPNPTISKACRDLSDRVEAAYQRK